MQIQYSSVAQSVDKWQSKNTSEAKCDWLVELMQGAKRVVARETDIKSKS